MSFSELASIIKGANLFVGADTVVMHLAAACQRPVFAIFGPSDEAVWHPWKTHFYICSARKKLRKTKPNHVDVDINILNLEDVWSELFLFINKV
jgi:heptosyltransferase-3